MNGVVIGALVALGMAQQTDTVFPVGDAVELSVHTMAGSIVVTGWDRDEVAVGAEHSARSYVGIRRRHDGAQIEVEIEARRGPATTADFEISVPRGFRVELHGTYADLTVQGVSGEVEVQTVQGDVSVRGGTGSVHASTMTGTVLVMDADGTIEAESAAGEIRLVNVGGEIMAESAGGDIVLEGVRSSTVDVGTVGGRIHYDGTLQAGGTYFFGSHGGTVTLVVPEDASATFNLSSVFGTVVNRLGDEPEVSEGGQRHRIEIGGGGAIVEAETFGGRIALVRRGAEGSAPPEPRQAAWDLGGEDYLQQVLAGVVDVATEAVERTLSGLSGSGAGHHGGAPR